MNTTKSTSSKQQLLLSAKATNIPAVQHLHKVGKQIKSTRDLLIVNPKMEASLSKQNNKFVKSCAALQKSRIPPKAESGPGSHANKCKDPQVIHPLSCSKWKYESKAKWWPDQCGGLRHARRLKCCFARTRWKRVPKPFINKLKKPVHRWVNPKHLAIAQAHQECRGRRKAVTGQI